MRKHKANGKFKKKKVPKFRPLKCDCGEQFLVANALFKQATVEQTREIFCPRGHEISWRGGTLGARLKTEELLRRELESQKRLIQNIVDMFTNHKRVIAQLERDMADPERALSAPTTKARILRSRQIVNNSAKPIA